MIKLLPFSYFHIRTNSPTLKEYYRKGLIFTLKFAFKKKEKSTHTDNNGKKILLIAIKKPLVPFPLLPSGKGFIYIEKENKMIKQFPGETMKWTRKKEREREKRKKEN